MRISKTTKQTIHHVLSYFITSHLDQVIRRRSQIWPKREVLSMGFSKGMAAFGGGILFTFLFCHFLVYADIKDHETNNSSGLIIFNHVSSKSSNQEAQIWQKREVLSMGFRKGMAAFGGGILDLHFSFPHFLAYADIKDHETNNSSCLIIFHHVSSKSSNQEEIPNLTETGGSKYGVPQGYGCIWRRYPFYIFVSSFLGLCGYERPRNKQFIMSYHISSRLI